MSSVLSSAAVRSALGLFVCGVAACASETASSPGQPVATAGAGTAAVSGSGPALAAGAGAPSRAPGGASGMIAAAVSGGSSATAGAKSAAGVAGTSAAGAAGAGARSMNATAGSGGVSAVAGSKSSAGSGGTSAAAGGAPSSNGNCEFPAPPADVADWVDQSWNAQLGNNVRSRKAWLLDNVMLNKGSLNLCVRWGATSNMPDSVRMNLAATTERWFNDWFKGLAGYGCFPYGGGITVKITGYAVRAGKQALLGAVDPSIPVYTETDADGEPKCPDACSSFEHWDHQFGSCSGGDAAHSDYWLWFDDKLPGNGGAAAVGGDWGLRMPVSTFLNAFEQPSFHITEHEMGHGFGIQDYYDWTGAKPKGGSIMIVGSTNSEPPTSADIWLLKRTWQEMKKLRNW